MDEEKTDMVNHPSHYTACRIALEPVDATELLPHPLASAVEYVLRSPYKGSEKQDLEKAVWWLKRFRDVAMYRLPHYDPKSRSKPSRYSSENDVLIEKYVKYTDFFLLSIVYV